MLNIENLINEKYKSVAKLPNFIKKLIYSLLKKLLYEKEINEFLIEHPDSEAFDFIEDILDYFNFSYNVALNKLDNIPSTGRVIIIANHPLGMLDALSLIHAIKQVREDVKIVANDVLSYIEPLKSLFLTVDVFGGKISKDSINKIYKSLDNEEAIIIFPSGEVSRFTPFGIQDTKWQKGFLNFALKKNTPILPVYIKAKNSLLFYAVSSINKPLSTFLLPHELFNKKGKSIDIKIGKLIPYESFQDKDINSKEKIMLFRRHLYNIAKNREEIFTTVNGISLPEKRAYLKKEFENAEILGKTNDGKVIYLFNYIPNSHIIKEIGRLRELSFRKVGEGTGDKRDIDIYDKYYKHLVLWDEESLEIIGSYRIGESDFIYNKFGIKGFYSNSLFCFQNGFDKYLNNSIELGRSFVQPKYWGSRALDYLWQGIGAYLKKNPQIRYMFGPVSLSASLSKDAQNLIIYYYDKYYGGKKELLKPMKAFVFTDKERVEMQNIFDGRDKKEDFLTLKRGLEAISASIPTLYKQYTELCEDGGVCFMGFNVDEKFNNCVDSFILVDIDKIKDKKRTRYIV